MANYWNSRGYLEEKTRECLGISLEEKKHNFKFTTNWLLATSTVSEMTNENAKNLTSNNCNNTRRGGFPECVTNRFTETLNGARSTKTSFTC